MNELTLTNRFCHRAILIFSFCSSDVVVHC